MIAAAEPYAQAAPLRERWSLISEGLAFQTTRASANVHSTSIAEQDQILAGLRDTLMRLTLEGVRARLGRVRELEEQGIGAWALEVGDDPKLPRITITLFAPTSTWTGLIREAVR